MQFDPQIFGRKHDIIEVRKKYAKEDLKMVLLMFCHSSYQDLEEMQSIR